MYLSITGATPDNKIAKYQECATEAEAIAHANEHNGFSIVNPGGNQEFWVVDMALKTVVIDTATQTTVLATRNWQSSMQATDSSMPRWFEDYIAENSVTLAPGRAKDSYDAKVALRAGRPV